MMHLEHLEHLEHMRTAGAAQICQEGIASDAPALKIDRGRGVRVCVCV